jgi:ribosomal protein S18 acetylase RimI-like enzyme
MLASRTEPLQTWGCVYDSSTSLRLAHENLAEANREQARWLPPAQLDERERRLFVACGTRLPVGPWNSALALGERCADPEAFVAAARAFFAPLRRGFSVYARSELDAELERSCQRAGLARVQDIPCMLLGERVAEFERGQQVEIRRAQGEADRHAFVAICAAAYESVGMRIETTHKLLSQSTCWLAPPWQTYLLRESGVPVAGAMLLFSHGIAGLYWVATLPAARGRGYADALTRAASNAAFAAGAGAVVLQASKLGEPVYRGVGFREIMRYLVWTAKAA